MAWGLPESGTDANQAWLIHVVLVLQVGFGPIIPVQLDRKVFGGGSHVQTRQIA